MSGPVLHVADRIIPFLMGLSHKVSNGQKNNIYNYGDI